MKKKLTSVFLALILAVAYMPTGLYAENISSAEAPAEEKAVIQKAQNDVKMLKELDSLNGEDEIMSFNASLGTIKGTISLPNGISAREGDRIKLYAYPAARLENGKLVYFYDDSKAETFVTMQSGDTSASYTLNVPDGEYNIAVRFYSGHKSISGEMTYYSADGAVSNDYLADAVSSNSSGINIRLKEADSYISGTIDLSKNVPSEDTYIYIHTNNQTNAYIDSCYAYIPVKEGQTSASYEIGTNSESSYLRVGSDYFKSRYYTSNGTLHHDYQKRAIFDTTNPIENLHLALLPYDKDVDKKLTCTINFSETYDESKTYYVSVKKISDTENWDYYAEEWLYVHAGESSATVDVFYSELPDVPVCLAYKDITGESSIYLENDSSMRFYSESFGVTGNIMMATDISKLDNLVVNEPDYTHIKGTLDLGTNSYNDRTYVYVGAEFENEVFCDRVLVSDKNFSINVPERLIGEEFKLFTAVNSRATVAEDTIEYKAAAYTLSSNMAGISIPYSSFTSVSGSITIPTPAPENGVTVELSFNDNSTYTDGLVGVFVIAPGETSVNYNALIPGVISAEDTILEAEISVYEGANIAPYAESVLISTQAPVDISFREAVTISGTISLPEGDNLDETIAFQVSASGMKSMWLYSYAAIQAGETSTTYSITVPKGINISNLQIMTSGTQTPYIRNLYYNGSEFLTNNTNANLVLENDTVIDAEIIKKAKISGVLKLPENSGYTGGSASFTHFMQKAILPEINIRSISITILFPMKFHFQ